MAESRASIVINAVDNTKIAINSVKSNLGALSAAGSSVTSVLSGLGLALSSGSIIAAIKSTADYADEMGKAAAKIGTTTEALSGLKYAGDLADVSFEQLQTGLAKLAKASEDFRDGSKSAVDTFTKLGIDPTQFNDTSKLLEVVAERFSKLEDGARKTAVAQELFGKSGAQLIPLLNSGAEGLRMAADEAARFGLIISEEAAKSAEEFNDNMTRLSTASKGLTYELGNQFLPALTDITSAMVEAAKESGLLMAAWVGLGGVMANALGLDPRSQAKDRLAEINREVSQIQGKLAGGMKSTTTNGLIPYTQAEIDEMVLSLKNLGIEAANLNEYVNPTAKPAANKPNKSDSDLGIVPATEKKSTGKTYAQQYAEDVASLMQAFQAATIPAQSVSEKLQDQLNAYTTINPAIRAYLQSIIDQTKATEDLAASIELNNSVMEATQQYDDAAANNARAISESYNAILQETQDFNTALIKDDQERAKAQLEIEHNRRIERIAMMQAEQEDIDLLLDAENDRFAAAQRALAAEATRSKGYMKDLGATFSSAFEDAIAGGKRFTDVLSGLASDIERILTRRFITDPLMKGLESLVIDPLSKAFGGIFANANGGVYSGAGISAYSGQIVSSPTVFPFAKGIGLMGEAGPEAIMPLRRGADGKLGVAGGGSNVTVNVFEAPGTKANVQQEQGADGQLNIKVVVEQLYGMMGRDISRGTGLAPVIERRYGLNRVSGGA